MKAGRVVSKHNCKTAYSSPQSVFCQNSHNIFTPKKPSTPTENDLQLLRSTCSLKARLHIHHLQRASYIEKNCQIE